MNRSQSSCAKLQRFDAFGAEIDFYYKGKGKFNTAWGCFCTAFVAVGYLIMVGLKCTEFLWEKDGIVQFSQQTQDQTDLINLTELGFHFAVENVDPKIGRFLAYEVSWDGETGRQIEKPIAMKPCDALKSGLKLQNEFRKTRLG